MIECVFRGRPWGFVKVKMSKKHETLGVRIRKDTKSSNGGVHPLVDGAEESAPVAVAPLLMASSDFGRDKNACRIANQTVAVNSRPAFDCKAKSKLLV